MNKKTISLFLSEYGSGVVIKKSILGAVLGAVFIGAFLYAGTPAVLAANSCTSNGTGGGSFSATSTWASCGGTTPQAVDSITILGGDAVTLVATTNIAGITINANGTLAANTRTLTDAGNYTNNGSHTGTTSAMTLGGTGTTIAGTGTYLPTGVVTISTGAKSVTAGSHLTFGKITITGVTLTNNSTAGFTVDTALAGTGQLTQAANAILNIGGTSAITTIDASAVPNAVHYISTTSNQTVKAATYYNLFLDKPGFTATMSGTTNIAGNLVSTASTTDFNTATVTITGTTDIYGALKDQNNTGLVTFGGLLDIHPGGSWSGNVAEACNFTFHNGMQYDGGSFVSGGGLFTFNTNNQSITGSSPVSIEYIVANGIQLTNSNASSVSATLSLSGTGEFIQGTNAVLNLGGAATITTLTASANGNVVNYNGAAAQIIKAATYQTLNVSNNATLDVSTGKFKNGAYIDADGSGTVSAGDTRVAIGGNPFSGLGFAIGSIVAASDTDIGTAIALPTGAGNLKKTGAALGNASASSTFIMGTNGAYIDMDNDGTVSAGDVRVAIGSALFSGKGYLPGSIVLGGDDDVETTIAAPTGINLSKTGSDSLNAYGSVQFIYNASDTIVPDTTVNTALILGGSKLSTGTNKLIMGSGATVSRTTGYVIGNLQKNIATGATSQAFEIGSVNAYAPVAIQFGNVTVAGNLIASTTPADHPNVSSSGLFADKTVNRYWSIVNSGVTFNNASATFTFAAGDVDAGANTANFILKKFAAVAWSSPAVGTVTPTSLQGTGITSFGDFAIGERPIRNVTSATADGAYTVGRTIDIEITFAENVFVTGVPKLALNSSGTASYVSGSGSSTLTFNYIVGAGDSSLDLDYASTTALTLNGGTIKDATSDNLDLNLFTPGTVGSLDANKNIIIDTAAPVITFTAPTKLSSSTISDTAIDVTDNIGIESDEVSVSTSSTAGSSNLNCVQTTSKKIDCTIDVTGSGDLAITAADFANNTSTATSSGYVITTAAPIITITAPTKLRDVPITDTTIHITDAHGVLVSAVTIDASTTASYSSFSCNQTDANTVDCTITINTTGNLVLDAVDVAGNPVTQAENNYIVDLYPPIITITAPTKLSSTTITDTIIHVTDNEAEISFMDISVATSSTVGYNHFDCTQTNATTADCDIHITSSGNLVINAQDVGINPATQTESNYVIDAVPTVTITAPTKSSNVPITNTTIHATDDNALPTANVQIDPLTTATYTAFNCNQTDSKTVDCTITITGSGNLTIDATDLASNTFATTTSGYVVSNAAPVITIGAPTKSSTSPITDTVVHVTDAVGINAANVTIGPLTTVGHNSPSCIQTDAKTVDCTLNITSTGNLAINAVDTLTNAATKSETGYTVDPLGHSIVITAPTKTATAAITDTTIHIFDTDGVVVADVNASSSTASFDSFACTQTDTQNIDCTVRIIGSGNLTIDLLDSLNNAMSATASGYSITAAEPAIVATMPSPVVGVAAGYGTINTIGNADTTPPPQNSTAGNTISSTTVVKFPNLGTTPSALCGPYLLKHITLGTKNDSTEVKKLQTFLQKYEGFTTLPITGFYGPITFGDVKQFQAKYSDDILAPWNIAAPTGIVARTTTKKVNALYCQDSSA